MRRILVSCALLAVLSLTVHSQTKPKAAKAAGAVPASYGNVDSISEEEMKIYLYFLASDQLEGRNLPSRGLDTAALYIASHLAEWGLKPGGSTTKTTGPLQPYLMPMELVSKQVLADQFHWHQVRLQGAGGLRRAAAGLQPPLRQMACDIECRRIETARRQVSPLQLVGGQKVEVDLHLFFADRVHVAVTDRHGGCLL